MISPHSACSNYGKKLISSISRSCHAVHAHVSVYGLRKWSRAQAHNPLRTRIWQLTYLAYYLDLHIPSHINMLTVCQSMLVQEWSNTKDADCYVCGVLIWAHHMHLTELESALIKIWTYQMIHHTENELYALETYQSMYHHIPPQHLVHILHVSLQQQMRSQDGKKETTTVGTKKRKNK